MVENQLETSSEDNEHHTGSSSEVPGYFMSLLTILRISLAIFFKNSNAALTALPKSPKQFFHQPSF